jgi:tetratricopeptide (TPR) repeat protein
MIPLVFMRWRLNSKIKIQKKREELFDQLLERHPTYLPTYYIAGDFYLEQGDLDRAAEILKKGLALAHQQKDLNSIREISAAIQNLED